MVITKDTTLPTDLDVKEVNLSTATLLAAAPYLGKFCEGVNNEFMLCRMELDDPRPCVDAGKKVTACTYQLFLNIKNNCCHEFMQYAQCIDKSSGDFSYKNCRKTQCAFDCCMKDNLEMERPEFGYFCRPRIHNTSRPEPQGPPCPCQPKVSDSTPSLPDEKPRYPARFTSRYYWMTE